MSEPLLNRIALAAMTCLALAVFAAAWGAA